METKSRMRPLSELSSCPGPRRARAPCSTSTFLPTLRESEMNSTPPAMIANGAPSSSCQFSICSPNVPSPSVSTIVVHHASGMPFGDSQEGFPGAGGVAVAFVALDALAIAAEALLR